MARDDQVHNLADTMRDVYAFVIEAEPLKKLDVFRPILEVMVKQTIECAYFLQDYARIKSFGM